MNKRKLDEIEEPDENCLKLSRQSSPEDKELCRNSNGDHHHHHHSILNINVDNSDKTPYSDFPKSEVGEKSNNCNNSLEIPPAKRISKRCTKKADKTSRGKVVTLGAVPTETSSASELIEEEQNCKGKRRTWERWSKEDTYIFFEGLNEYGKDFDKLQAHFKSKYRSRKLNRE